MEQEVKELTLLLLYLTSWKEDDLPEEIRRSWKGYPFEILDQLNEEDLIRGSKRAKSTYLTKTGVEQAKALAKKYQVDFL